MRIWNVKPELMCRKHLFGEHVETHMFVGTMNRHKSLNGYIANGLIETDILLKRHDELAEEIVKRGYSHHSPIELSPEIQAEYAHLGSVDVANSLKELATRCKDCRIRQQV